MGRRAFLRRADPCRSEDPRTARGAVERKDTGNARRHDRLLRPVVSRTWSFTGGHHGPGADLRSRGRGRPRGPRRAARRQLAEARASVVRAGGPDNARGSPGRARRHTGRGGGHRRDRGLPSFAPGRPGAGARRTRCPWSCAAGNALPDRPQCASRPGRDRRRCIWWSGPGGCLAPAASPDGHPGARAALPDRTRHLGTAPVRAPASAAGRRGADGVAPSSARRHGIWARSAHACRSHASAARSRGAGRAPADRGSKKARPGGSKRSRAFFLPGVAQAVAIGLNHLARAAAGAIRCPVHLRDHPQDDRAHPQPARSAGAGRRRLEPVRRLAGAGRVRREQARLQSHAGLLRIGRGLIRPRPAAGNDHRGRPGVLRSSRMVAGKGREPAAAISAVQALISAHRDGAAARSADTSYSGERLGRNGPAAVGCALLVDRQFPSTPPRCAAARNHNVSGAARRCLPAPLDHAQRLSASGREAVSSSQGSSFLRGPGPVRSRRRAGSRPGGLARPGGRRDQGRRHACRCWRASGGVHGVAGRVAGGHRSRVFARAGSDRRSRAWPGAHPRYSSGRLAGPSGQDRGENERLPGRHGARASLRRGACAGTDRAIPAGTSATRRCVRGALYGRREPGCPDQARRAPGHRSLERSGNRGHARVTSGEPRDRHRVRRGDRRRGTRDARTRPVRVLRRAPV